MSDIREDWLREGCWGGLRKGDIDLRGGVAMTLYDGRAVLRF